MLGDAGDVVVPELEDSQTVTVLQTQDLFHGGQPVLLKVQLLQEGQAEDGAGDPLQTAARQLQSTQVPQLLQAVVDLEPGPLVVNAEPQELAGHVHHARRDLG